MKYIASLLVVDSIAKARELYEGVLEQKVLYDYGENITFEGGFSIHEREHFEALINRKSIKMSNSFEIYFEHNDLEPVEEKLKRLDLEFVHGVIEQPWRQKVMRFYDFDKNLVEIGEALDYTAYRLNSEGMPLDTIAKTVYMDIDGVKKSILKYQG